MREIKFRCWDTKGKKWINEVPCVEYLLDNPDWDVSHHDIDSYENSFFYPQNPLGPTFEGRLVYQQFTGILDSNGKEIYEGDIVQFYKGKDYRAEYEVHFSKGEFSLISAKREGDEYGVFTKYISRCPIEGFIIGNIFENPDLLK